MCADKPTILVTGATGYIASHTIVELLNQGFDVIGIDNLAASKKAVISRITALTNRSMIFRQVDIRDKESILSLFDTYSIQSVIHFAGYKAVGESVANPMKYYSNNLKGSITLLEAMHEQGVKNLVFSSSCTVYGDAKNSFVTEDQELAPTNPYGRTKYMIEQMLNDISSSDNEWNIISLRYFNPIGAHPSGKIGEDPLGIPNNLLPYVSQTALGKREYLSVFGGDYSTRDGTCIRDYIHVCDLAKGHLAAIEKLSNYKYEVFNLGTGIGHSVLEVIDAFEHASSRKINFKIQERREGDAAAVWADPRKAQEQLNWQADRNLADMCKDAWNFQSENPEGYASDLAYNNQSGREAFSSIDNSYSTNKPQLTV